MSSSISARPTLKVLLSANKNSQITPILTIPFTSSNSSSPKGHARLTELMQNVSINSNENSEPSCNEQTTNVASFDRDLFHPNLIESLVPKHKEEYKEYENKALEMQKLENLMPELTVTGEDLRSATKHKRNPSFFQKLCTHVENKFSKNHLLNEKNSVIMTLLNQDYIVEIAKRYNVRFKSILEIAHILDENMLEKSGEVVYSMYAEEILPKTDELSKKLYISKMIDMHNYFNLYTNQKLNKIIERIILDIFLKMKRDSKKIIFLTSAQLIGRQPTLFKSLTPHKFENKSLKRQNTVILDKIIQEIIASINQPDFVLKRDVNDKIKTDFINRIKKTDTYNNMIKAYQATSH